MIWEQDSKLKVLTVKPLPFTSQKSQHLIKLIGVVYHFFLGACGQSSPSVHRSYSKLSHVNTLLSPPCIHHFQENLLGL